MDKNKEASEILDKIVFGLELSFKKLVQQKIKEDAELIFATKDGEIVRIKAKDL
jgi:hypothetical protein